MPKEGTYLQIEKQIKKLKCPICNGLGIIFNAELGDIYFNTYQCKYCLGTGWKSGKLKRLIHSTKK